MNTSLTLLKSIPNRLPMAIRTMLLMLVLLVTGTAIVHAQPTILVDPAGAGGFELGSSFADNGWTAANSANNPWVLGLSNTTAPFGGYSAYISADGLTPGYLNTAAASNFFWRDIVVPAGEERVNVSFNWLSGGESSFDLWQVFFVPITTTPAGSTTYPGLGLTAIPSSLPGAVLVTSGNLQATTVQTFSGAAYLPAGSYRIVFHWKNDGSGGTPPGASIDNISVSAQAASTFTSIASGNWSAPATWGGSVPSPADNVVVDVGHTVTIDAVGQAAQSVTISGTLTYGTTPTEFQAKDLTVIIGGLVNVFAGTTAKTLRVSGNLTNDGRVNTLASSTANGTLNLNGGAPQTVSGSGVWGGTLSAVGTTNEVGVIGSLSITNTSSSIPCVNYTMGGTLRIRGTLTLTGAINLNTATWIRGNYAAGSLTVNGNGGVYNGTYGHWWTTTSTGTAITAGTDPSNTTSQFPLLSIDGSSARRCWVTRSSTSSTGNTAGEVLASFTLGNTRISGNAFVDGSYNVSDYWEGTWTITTASGYVYASGTHTLTAVAPSLFAPSSSNARLMVNGGTFVGNHQAGTGTPGAQRIGLTTAQLTSTNGFVMGIGSTDLCSPSVAAINENFDSYGTGNMVPFCWDRIIVGTASQTISSTTPASGTRNIWQSSSPGTASYVVLPQMTDMLNVSSGNYRLKFKARTSTASGQLAVGYFPASSLVASSFVLISNVALTNTTYGSETVVNIPAGIPAGSRLAIANLGVSTESHYWDDVVYEEVPSCIEPTAPVFASSGTTGMQFTFTAPSTVPSNGYDVYYSTSNTAPTAGTVASAGTSASGSAGAVAGLSPNTVYYVWIRSNCGSSGTSPWSGPISFTTPCEPSSVPYSEGFENAYTHNSAIVNCWSQASVAGSGVWTANNTLTTYNRSPRTGAWNAFLVYSNNRWLMREFNLTGGISYTFSMYARQDGADPLNASVAVAYGNAGTSAAMTNPIVASTGLVNGNYQLITGTFTPSTSGVYFVGINGTINSTPWYITIDDISLIETPACVPPSGLASSAITNNSASLSWTASASSNNYEVAIQAAGAGAPAGAGVAVSGTSYAATGLNAATNYEYYVRTVCSSANSPWAGPFAFSTAVCAASSTCNYTINMTDVYGDGWDGTVIGLRQSGILVGTFGGAGFASGASATASIALCPGLATEIVLVDPGAYPTEKRFTILDPFGVQVYALTTATSPLPALFGTFTSSCTPPACQVPSGLAASAVTESGATIAWTAGGSEASWEISIQAPGLGEPTANGTSVSANSYVATGLISNTAYQVYLRAVCSPTNKSNWIGPINIRTLCGAFATPLFESFEVTQGTAYCWSGNFAAGSTPGWQWIRLPSGSAPSNQTPALPDTMAMRIPFYGISSGSFSLNSPTFTATTSPSVLRFNYAYAAYSAVEIDQLEILASSDAGVNYSSLSIMDGGPVGPLNTGGTASASFVPTSTQWGTRSMLIPVGTNKVSFKGISAWGNNLYIDNVSVTPCSSTATAISASICQGQSYNFGSQTLTAAGVYSQTLVASTGCDSVVSLTLTVNPIQTSSISASICEGQSYSFGSQSLTLAGVYSNTVAGSNGCDSVVTLTLSVTSPATSIINETVPNGGSFTVCGQSYNASGTYTKICAGAAASGCDSVVTLNLTVEPPVSVSIANRNACFVGDTVSVPVQMAFGRGVGAISLAINYDTTKLTFVDAVNIDPAVSTILVNASVFGGLSQVRAGWYATANPIDFSGNLFTMRFVATASTTLEFDLATPGNCEIADFDAIAIAGATFNNGTVGVGQMLQANFAVNGNVLSVANNSVSICQDENFNFTLSSVNNGSAPLNLTWEVLDANNVPVSGFPTSASNAGLGAILFSQAAPLTPGTYTIRATSVSEVNGCAIPSAILAQYYVSTIVVKPRATATINETIAYGSTFTVCGQTYNAAGTYTKVCAGAASNGCDSVVTLNLTILPPPCPAPSALAVSGITASGATFGWTAGGTESAWEISIQTVTGVPVGNGTSISSNPYTATGLISNTVYRVYLRAACSSVDKSPWIGPVSFRTLCSVFNLPFFESFETAQGTVSCWSGNFAAGSTPGWQYIRLSAGSAPSNQTPALPDTFAMRIPFYSIASGSYSLNTPTFTANPVGAVLTFNYAYAAYSAAEIDKLEIMASTDDGATYTSLEIMNGGPNGPLNTGGTTSASFVPTTAQWGLKTVNLPANTNRVSFKGISEYGNNLYIDNVRVANPPPCSAPTAPAVVAGSVGSSTASISWTAPATAPANGYQLHVSTSSTAPDGTTNPTHSSQASPAVLTGLTPATAYFAWVRSACAIGTSSWVGPVSFTTTCLESNIPTSENFDSHVATGGTANTGTAVPPCWSRANGTSPNSAWRTYSLTNSAIGSTSGANILATFPAVTTAKSDWAFTTGYNLVGGTTYTLRFKVRAPGNGPNRERLGIYLANARTSTAMLAGPRIYNDSSLQASGWQSRTARLTPTTSGVYYLGIRAYSVANAGYIGIDDWSLEVTTSEVVGTLKYQGGASVLDNSTVTLSGAVSGSATTSASGAFAFTGLGNGAVTLTASTNKTWGGITATDALATTRHYQGIGLVSGLNLAAADVNLSALVNATDALMIINRYNGSRNNFPAGDWKFESKNYNLNLSEITTDLFGIAIGDVNNSYSPAAGRQFIGLNLAEGGVQSISDENWMDVRVDRALEMGALSLALDIPSGVRVEQVVSNLEGGRFDYNVHNGQLRLTWFDVAGVKLVPGQSLFRMRIASDRSVAVSDWTVAEGSEIADPLAQVMEMVGLRMPSLRGLQADLVASVYPNPTQGMSSVRLNLPAAGELKLRLVDVLGKVVMSQTVTSQALNTELPVDMSSLAAGRYELQIELNAGGRNYRTHLPVQRRD